jgi:EAL domain-containing protein (putative c-di-GMP-specific phosphodiesterase class I)
VNIRTGSLAGLEALVRWRHPTDGLLLPFRFLPVAEHHGMSGDLTRAVLRSAMAEIAHWAASGLYVKVAVNVSMGDLDDVRFPDALAELAAEFDVRMDSLSLEVTEGQLMTEPRSQLDVLTRLRLKGVRLSIDDFGTGYSCLAQLRDLPFDELKVDRSFVGGASRDPALKAILDASLGLARQMGISSVGEGVETVDDWHCLRRAGCNVAQGYLIARPMSAEHVQAWMHEWATRFAALDAADQPARADTP